MPQTIYDITRTISPTIAVWPGDPAFKATQVASLDNGDVCNVMRLDMSPHTGTHIDAPWHITPEKTHPADVDLAPYIGPARLISLDDHQGAITPDDLAGYDLSGVTRLVIRTWYSTVPDDVFHEGWACPTPEAIDYLADMGITMIAMDIPSFDPLNEPGLPTHNRIFERGLRNVELLQLSGIPAGDYEFIALPLKIAGICGCPVRALLRTLE